MESNNNQEINKETNQQQPQQQTQQAEGNASNNRLVRQEGEIKNNDRLPDDSATTDDGQNSTLKHR